MKHTNEELAETLNMDIHSVCTKDDIDIPFEIMEPMKYYLPYCSEFKDNHIKESDLNTAKHIL